MQFSNYTALTDWIALHWHDAAHLRMAQATLAPFIAQNARHIEPQGAELWRTSAWTLPVQRSTNPSGHTPQPAALRWLDSPDDAQTLVHDLGAHDELDLSGLTELPGTVAGHLAQFAGTLNLSGLVALTPDLVEALAAHRGLIRLDGLQDLRYLEPLVLRRIPRAPSSPSVSQPGLSLCAKTRLSAEEAHTLSHVQGELNLSGLQDISPKLASTLNRQHASAELPVGCLRLDGWQNPTAQALEALADYSGPLSLALDAGTSFNASMAALIKQNRYGLALPRLQTLTEDMCQRLAMLPVQNLQLNGVATINRPCALVLAKAPWSELQLNALQTMTLETAAAFLLQNDHGTMLQMDSLTVDPELRKTMQKHENLGGILAQKIWD